MLDPRVVEILKLRPQEPKIKLIKKTTIEMFPDGSFRLLSPEEFDVLGVFIMQGGCGWKAALATQDVMWSRFGGETINILKRAIVICNFHVSEVLWDAQVFHKEDLL